MSRIKRRPKHASKSFRLVKEHKHVVTPQRNNIYSIK